MKTKPRPESIFHVCNPFGRGRCVASCRLKGDTVEVWNSGESQWAASHILTPEEVEWIKTRITKP